MVLAAPGPLLTPPPSSSPPKTPYLSYSAQIRSQNEEKTPPGLLCGRLTRLPNAPLRDTHPPRWQGCCCRRAHQTLGGPLRPCAPFPSPSRSPSELAPSSVMSAHRSTLMRCRNVRPLRPPHVLRNGFPTKVSAGAQTLF